MLSQPSAAEIWSTLDEPWRAAFDQAWQALRSGTIPVGACISTLDGEIVHAARNRVFDSTGPPGEVFGCALAHAEINALARVPSRHHRDLVLTTTLEPCLQCAAAIRLSAVTTVRFAGADLYWEGCHDFTKLSAREATRPQPMRIGPTDDELGLFGTLISRLGPPMAPGFERWLRDSGEGPMLDVVDRINQPGELERLASLEVVDAFAALLPDLRRL